MNDLVANLVMREKILTLQDRMMAYVKEHPDAEPELPLRHTFAPGAYARQMFIPGGTLVVGKIHKHAHLNLLMMGIAVVATEDGIHTYAAPYVFTSLPGTKRVVLAMRDLIWVTVHLTELTDPEAIVEEMTVPTYDDFDALRGIDIEQFCEAIVRQLP